MNGQQAKKTKWIDRPCGEIVQNGQKDELAKVANMAKVDEKAKMSKCFKMAKKAKVKIMAKWPNRPNLQKNTKIARNLLGPYWRKKPND